MYIVMGSDEANYKIIYAIYYDKSGYGSVNITFPDAREKAEESNSSITKKSVLGWLSRNIGKQSQPSGQNSCVAPSFL